MQRHFDGKNRSKWSLRGFILEGSHILWEVQETEILQSRNPFLVVDAHDHFLIWYFELRDFLVKNEYLDETYPDFSKVALLFEAGRVPRTRGSAIDVEGIGYGNPHSEESKTLLRNIREETKNILAILSELRPVLNKKQRGVATTSNQSGFITLFLNKATGDLWKEPKNKYCYPMMEKKERRKLLEYFIKKHGKSNQEFTATENIEIDLERDTKSIRTEIGKINAKSLELLKIGSRTKGKKPIIKNGLIESKQGSGYRLNPLVRIEIHK